MSAITRIDLRSAWHGAAMARHGRRPSPAPATRPVGFSPAARHATRFFPVPPATPRRATPSPANGFFTNHETRNTNHGLYAFLPTISHDFPAFPTISRPYPHPPGKGSLRRRAVRSLLSFALWCGMGRLWRGMGGGRPPRRQHGRLGFHQQRDTQHVFPCPSGDSKESNPKPGLRGFSRITNHEHEHESRPLCFSSHDFPAFPAILRYPPPPGIGVRAPSAAAPAALRAASAAANAK